MGYHQAGFEVLGVDIEPQPNYPFEFWRADALSVLDSLSWSALHGIQLRWQAIHASPPCQSYSAMSHCRPGLADDYAALVDIVRRLLGTTGVPWVIENVPGAPLVVGGRSVRGARRTALRAHVRP